MSASRLLLEATSLTLYYPVVMGNGHLVVNAACSHTNMCVKDNSDHVHHHVAREAVGLADQEMTAALNLATSLVLLFTLLLVLTTVSELQLLRPGISMVGDVGDTDHNKSVYEMLVHADNFAHRSSAPSHLYMTNFVHHDNSDLIDNSDLVEEHLDNSIGVTGSYETHFRPQTTEEQSNLT